MASVELLRLWKLAQIDNALNDIRKRAAALDVGKTIAAEVQQWEAKEAEVGGNYRSLHAEQKDLELQQQGIEDKLKRIDKEMYGGKVTSSREVATLEKEIEALKRQRDRNDERLLELMEVVPPAQARAKKVQDGLEDAKARLVARKKQALQDKANLESEFKRLTAARPEAAKGISPTLLARYDGIRQKAGGVGMVEVNGRSCGGCGTQFPERTLQALKEDKVATCEACKRILYFTEGVV